MNQQISQLPTSQRRLLNFEREFNLQNTLFTFLLQKRAEAQITKASNLPDNQVIDVARAEGKSPIFPKKSLNYLIAITLGLVIPGGYVFIKDYFNDKIIEKKDIEKITSLPIIGYISHNTREAKMVVAEWPKSSIAEAFRALG